MFSIQGIDDIYFDRTKEYFKEVLSSFFNDNYRSAIVMLYSTVICDICLKLRELENVYGDLTAKQILQEVNNLQNGDNKSAWEKRLIDLVCEKGYINLKLYSDIAHLYSDRCFSSHPSMDEDYKLMSPSKEMTIAHIKNMLDELFVDPPTFNKNMVGAITDGLEQRKDAFVNDEQIKHFLYSAYYSRMTDFALTSLFKSLWAFCFNKPNDSNCKSNAEINRKALLYLYCYKPSLIEKAKESGFAFKISNEYWCIDSLIRFLSITNTYSYIDDSDRLLVAGALSNDYNLKAISWFCFDSFALYHEDFCKTVSSGFPYDYDYDILLMLKDKYENEGKINDYLGICVSLFGNVNDFYKTVGFYNKYIRNHLVEFDETHLESILKTINDNRCIHGCYAFDPSEVYRVYKNKTKQNPDFSKYKNLKRNPEYIEPKDDDSDKNTF